MVVCLSPPLPLLVAAAAAAAAAARSKLTADDDSYGPLLRELDLGCTGSTRSCFVLLQLARQASPTADFGMIGGGHGLPSLWDDMGNILGSISEDEQWSRR